MSAPGFAGSRRSFGAQGLLYLGLFVLIASALCLAYWLLSRSAAVQVAVDKDVWSGVLQATIGIAVAFAGALVAIKIALSAESLAAQGERREQFQEMTRFLSDTQSQFGELGAAVRALLRACTLPSPLRTQLEDFGLERLIREPKQGFSSVDHGYDEHHFDRLSLGFRRLPETEYRIRAERIAKLGLTSQLVYDGEDQGEDDVVTDHAESLQRRLRNGESNEELTHASREAARQRLELIASHLLATAKAVEDTVARFDCLGTFLSGDTVADGRTLTSVEEAVAGLRKTADQLFQGDPLLLLGKASHVVDELKVQAGDDSPVEDEMRVRMDMGSWRSIETSEKALALLCLLLSSSRAFPGQGNYALLSKGHQILTTLFELFPGPDAYQRHFDVVGSQVASDERIRIELPAMSFLGARTHLGQQANHAYEVLGRSHFPYETTSMLSTPVFYEELGAGNPDETPDEIVEDTLGLVLQRDEELENLLLRRATQYWLGNRYNDYLHSLDEQIAGTPTP